MQHTNIPIHRDVIIAKKALPHLPRGFEPTLLGYLREGAIAQYRGPNALHVHEYARHWLVHRDYGDPRFVEGVLAHLVYDAPEIPLSIIIAGIFGVAVGSIVYDIRKNESKDARTEAVIAGAIASIIVGAITFFVLRKK